MATKNNEQTLCAVFSQTNSLWLKKTVKFYKTYKAAKAAIRCFRRHRVGCAPYAMHSNDACLKGIKNKPRDSYAVLIYRKA